MTSLGIVGVGYWGKKVLTEAVSLQNEGQLSEISICDLDPQRLDEARKLAPSATAFSNTASLLKDPSLEFVYIATSNDTHFQLARQALEAGKHVLLEKPMTTDSTEALRLIEIAQDSSLRLAVGHIYRFNNAVSAVRSLMMQKAVGRPRSFDLSWTAMTEPFTDRTVVWDLAPHPLDILSLIQPAPPETIWAKGRSIRSAQLDEVTASLEYPNGVLATMTLSWASPLRRRTVQIEGSEGQILLEAAEQHVSIAKAGGDSTKIKIARNNTVRDQLSHFIQDRTQKLPMVNGAGEGLRVVHQIEAIHRSLEPRSRVAYNPIEVAV